MNTINITPIIEAAIALMAAIITTFIIPWIKAKITADQYNTLKLYARTTVAAAEMIMTGGGRGEEKLQYAQEKVNEMLSDAGLYFNDEIIRATIEEAVKDIKYGNTST